MASKGEMWVFDSSCITQLHSEITTDSIAHNCIRQSPLSMSKTQISPLLVTESPVGEFIVSYQPLHRRVFRETLQWIFDLFVLFSFLFFSLVVCFFSKETWDNYKIGTELYKKQKQVVLKTLKIVLGMK